MTCFVIMPFSKTSEEHTEQYWTDFFSDFLKPEIESFGYKCERSKAAPANIISNIIKQLSEANIVIAVLTDFNANVWYELGIRHTFKKSGTIMIIEDGQRLPFDISHYGVIPYKVDVKDKFKEQVKYFLEKIESNTQADNPVQDFIYQENLHVNRTSLSKANELLDGINWANVPLAELVAFSEPKFHFHISNKASYKVIDVSTASKSNGAVVHLWDLHEGDNQIWEIRPRYGNVCIIVSKRSGKCLEVKDGSIANEAQIQQNTFKNLKHQLWEILPNDDGTYRILAQSTKKCLEADSRTVHDNGGRIIQYDYTDSNHQKWMLTPIPLKFK